MTKSNSAFPISHSAFSWLFIAATLAVYFGGLTLPLVGPDEPRYAQVAREMFERGDWITPTLGGFNWFEKPALLYWLQIASYNLFGVSEFAARFGSVIFGLGTVLCLWILGKQVEAYGNDGERESSFGLANWMALIGASTIGIIAFAHGASFDIILTFPITAALVSFFIYDLRGKLVWLVSFYFFVGISLLAKGLIGIVFPFAIVSLYHLLSWKFPTRTVLISLFWGTTLAAAVAATWYVPMYLRHGYEFIDQFLIQHHFQRYTSNKYLHPQPFHFFFWVLPLMTIPWLPFFVASLWRSAKRIVKGDETPAESQGAPRSLLLFAIAWIAVPLVFFSFSGSKLPGYILPAVPATVILSADTIYRFIQKAVWRTYLVQAIAAATFVVSLIAIYVIAPGFAEADSVKGLFGTAHARGFDGLPVLSMHRASHNAEFYATGPLLRDAEGKQIRITGPKEVAEELRAMGKTEGLVLIPPEYIHHLAENKFVESETLNENGEWALTFVRVK